MTDRHQRILASLVAEYIDQGEPVSSAWLAEHSSLGLSSATVRTILAQLEDQGLIHQPHTSAGRVPTDHGYRVYVDQFLGARRRAKTLPEIEARLRRSGTVGDLLEHASQELSRASHQIGFAVAPANPHVRFEHIDFVGLDGAKVLVIVVATGGQVSQRVIETEAPFRADDLQQAANYVNAHFTGLTLDEARTRIVERMREERLLYDALVRRALTLAQSGLEHVQTGETLHVQGASFLLGGPGVDTVDERTLATLAVLFRLIEEKHQLIELLSRSIEARGLTVVIGQEHASPALRPFSLVISTFDDGGRVGRVGVIGPTRMRYPHAISMVEGVSRTVSRLLDGQ
jgi:heat-inducible transcriptional repressor